MFKDLQTCRSDLRELSAHHQGVLVKIFTLLYRQCASTIDCNEELDYGMSMQKHFFENAFGMKIKLTAGTFTTFFVHH